MKRLLFLLALTVPAFAAKTTITDVLVKSNSTFCSGTISISNPAFTSIDGPIAAATVTTNINGTTGRFTIALEPGPYYSPRALHRGISPDYGGGWLPVLYVQRESYFWYGALLWSFKMKLLFVSA